MTYTFIDDILVGYTFDLVILRPNTTPYRTSLLQHKGVFHFSEAFFGNQTDVTEKFTSFFHSVKENNSNLAITPEYSCPWNAIIHLLDNSDSAPDRGNLWVLGCESISVQRIQEIQEQYSGNNNIEIIFNDNIEQGNAGVLLDPCCSIFKADNPDGEEKLIVLVQFKTQHMGVWESDLEQQKLISGENVYILRNNADSINLLTIICSDALAFNGNEITNQHPGRWEHLPYIVLSLQMNPKPAHQGFRNFRDGILRLINKDVISLNWSSDSRASFDNTFFNKFSKSNILIRTEHIKNEAPDEQNLIKSNHSKGLYYTLLKPNRHTFYLSPEIEFAVLGLRKPYAGPVNPALDRRRGPTVDLIFQYDNEHNNFVALESVDDGLQSFLQSIGVVSESLVDDGLDVLDKERLINLSVGEIEVKNGNTQWQIINKLTSFLMEDSEIIRRYTVTFDEDGDEFRTTRLTKFEELNLNILTRPELFPDIIATFRDNCSEVMFFNDNGYNYQYNLVSDDNQLATVAHIGNNSKGNANNLLNKLSELFPKEHRRNNRIVVWYKPNVNDYEFVATPVPNISNTEPNNFTSITKTDDQR